jgi:cyclopropane fatty-acyl-phospholipid synthase-like methyltransferase
MVDEITSVEGLAIWPPPGAPLPIAELAEVVHLLTRRFKALDLGCGDGGSALALAELGFSTTAVDSSPAAVRELQRIARAHHLPLRAVRADPLDFPLRGVYDLIVVRDCFPSLHADGWRTMIQRFQRCTRRGGFNVIVAAVDPPGQTSPTREQEASREPAFAELYQGWKVLVQQCYAEPAQHRRTGTARIVNKIVAQRK